MSDVTTVCTDLPTQEVKQIKHRSHCKHGHKLEARSVGLNCRGHMTCRECAKAASQKYRNTQSSQLKTEVAVAQRRRRARKYREKLLSEGALRFGYTRLAILAIKPTVLDQIVSTAISANDIQAAYALLSRSKVLAVLAFRPEVRSRLSSVIRRPAAKKCYSPAASRPLTGRIAAQPHSIFSAVDAAIPRSLPGFMRDEIVGDMALAILEGSLAIEDAAKQARRFIADYNRMFPTKYGMASLDAPAFRNGAMPLVETISVGLWQ